MQPVLSAPTTSRRMITAVIDPLPVGDGEDRCRHDQLILAGRSTCSLCRCLPDVPELQFVDARVELPRSSWLLTDRYVDCVSCHNELAPNTPVQWSREMRGIICRPCTELAS